MNQWEKLADDATIAKTIAALESNGIMAVVAENRAQALEKIFEFLPEGSEVMNMTSVTLSDLGAADTIVSSGKFNSVRAKLMTMPEEERNEKNKLGAVHEYVIGSVHAVTEDGSVLIASNTGSQLGSYAYGAAHVIWVLGTQKIVPNFEAGIKRIYEHSLPLENERAQKAYGKRSNVSKILVVNKEVISDRIKIILVKEKLGF